MEVYVEVDEWEILRDMSSDELKEELAKRGEYFNEENGINGDDLTKLREYFRFKTPEQTLDLLDKLLFPR